jgi:hypothetical protein
VNGRVTVSETRDRVRVRASVGKGVGGGVVVREVGKRDGGGRREAGGGVGR